MSSKRARKHILTYQKETEASAKRKKFSAKPCACLDIELTAYLHEQDTLHTLLMLIEAQLTQTPNCLALRHHMLPVIFTVNTFIISTLLQINCRSITLHCDQG